MSPSFRILHFASKAGKFILWLCRTKGLLHHDKTKQHCLRKAVVYAFIADVMHQKESGETSESLYLSLSKTQYYFYGILREKNSFSWALYSTLLWRSQVHEFRRILWTIVSWYISYENLLPSKKSIEKPTARNGRYGSYLQAYSTSDSDWTSLNEFARSILLLQQPLPNTNKRACNEYLKRPETQSLQDKAIRLIRENKIA